MKKKIILSELILVIINILLFPVVIKQPISYSDILIFFLLATPICSFILGLIVALVPYKQLPYKKKYLITSLFSIVGINILITTCLLLLFIMAKLGWYGREYSNATQKPLSDTLIVYDDSGRVRAKGIMINKHKEGNWKEWDERGAISTDMNYRNGLAEGLGTGYHPNGKKQIEGNYIKQKPDGHFIAWYPNGNKQAEGNFKMGVKIGIWKTWFEDGKPGEDINYDIESK
jgi:MORN repeat protein